MELLRQTRWLLWKDLLLEARRRESLLAMFFFGMLLLFVFRFAFEMPSEKTAEMAPGLLWLAFLFTGTLGLNQLFQAERESQCLEALLLSPIDRGSLFLSKVLFNILLMLSVELVTLPLFWVLFNLDFRLLFSPLPLVVLLGTVGFCALGTLFSAVTLKARARELLLPLILFPLMVPVILGTVRGMEVIFRTGAFEDTLSWLRLLLGFDLIFLTAGFLIFEWVIES